MQNEIAQVLSDKTDLIVEKLEALGYVITNETINILESYYPIVRRRVLTGAILWFLGGFLVLFVAFKFCKAILTSEDLSSDDLEYALGIMASLFMGGISFIMIVTQLVRIINIDYYTIEAVIEKIAILISK